MPGKAGKQTVRQSLVRREQRLKWYMRKHGHISHVAPGTKTCKDFSTAMWLPDYSPQLDFVDDKHSFLWNWKTRLKFLPPFQVGKINQYELLLNSGFSSSLEPGMSGSQSLARWAGIG